MVDLTPIAPIQQQAVEYLYGLPDEVLKGNVFAMVIFLFLLYCAIYLIQKFTTLLVFVLKKVFLLIIVSLAFYEFVRVFALKIAIEGITTDTLIFGAVGAIIGLVALFIALYVALHSIIRLQKGTEEVPEPALPEEEAAVPEEEAMPVPSPAAEPAIRPPEEMPPPEEKAAPGPSLATTVREEISGVFSSKTIAAPTIEAGLMFFVAFLLASVVFIRLTYHDYWRGIRHLAAALLIGGVLSIILGFFWGGIPLEQLLSLSYFTTDALVALITGLALSLFMGSMN
ncbi:MAG: hypothetical protein GKC05_08560 [Methanomicrobiales archaeon]|nr:hypothetical protein [Methanomicrobiales archaeon]